MGDSQIEITFPKFSIIIFGVTEVTSKFKLKLLAISLAFSASPDISLLLEINS